MNSLLATVNEMFGRIDELSDLYSAEKQLVAALLKMAKGANAESLREAILQHLEETEGQVERLDQVFEQMGEKPKRKKCKAMEGLIEEGSEILKKDGVPEVKDAAIIGAAQRVEHYEIAGYGTARVGGIAVAARDRRTSAANPRRRGRSRQEVERSGPE